MNLKFLKATCLEVYRIAYTFLKLRLRKSCTLFIKNTEQSRHGISIIN